MATTGYPGKKETKGIGGASLERVQFEAEQAAAAEILEHEGFSDPHPQYTTEAEVLALSPPPKFVTLWKWS